MTDGTVYRIKPTGTNDCLTYGSNKKLSLQPCSDADEGQKWANKGGATNFQLIRGTNMCLNKNGKVSECKNTNAYKWNKTVNSQLKSKHDGNKCLQKKGISRNVEMAGCNNTDSQEWDMAAVTATGPPPPSASPGSPSPSSNSPGSPGSSPAGSTSPSSTTTPTPSPSDGDEKFWETTWFFWSAIGGGAFIVLSVIICIAVMAMSGGQASHHHPW